ncbi:TIGR03084 family protein [Actinacidiphila yanglinensis]|uniref:TIGR03084 family protein n=1 Tax=Actinacidiphila yanglinensis TaxID=310779 RepID=A0A1H5XYQ0_9ACTN|nr:TIGR03084 family metal-binding protein [Actinacidiphila yanglinensis]SEG16762.1 TIGR03084 family protein [Actinacidiphila yanglinensis]
MADPQAVRAVLDDLRAESEALDGLVAGLGTQQWSATTPAVGWTVAHQIAHLAWTDDQALLAVRDPDRFAVELALAAVQFETHVDKQAAAGAATAPSALLARWRAGREQLQAALDTAPPDARFPWFGPPMSTASMATARLMETWAHGEDVADTLGVRRAPTARLWHVARIAVRARDYAFAVHGATPPAEPFRVELTSPDGALWTYGPEQAVQKVTGPALDFCLLAVRRRHRDDTAVRAQGPGADAWLSIAQAFAGPPGPGRAPGAGGGAA